MDFCIQPIRQSNRVLLLGHFLQELSQSGSCSVSSPTMGGRYALATVTMLLWAFATACVSNANGATNEPVDRTQRFAASAQPTAQYTPVPLQATPTVEIMPSVTPTVAWTATLVADSPSLPIGELVAVSVAESNPGIFVLRDRILTRISARDSSGGSLSPDGRRLTYYSRIGSTPGISVINIDGTGEHLVFNRGEHPVWSKDGNSIVFADYVEDASGGLFQVNVMGGEPIRLAPSWQPRNFPEQISLSPDGRYLAASVPLGSGVQSEIDVIDLAQGVVKRTIKLARTAAWSPDGARIAFGCADLSNHSFDVCAMNLDGSGLTRPTTDPADDYAPTWSPDGKYIAFISLRAGSYAIYIMNFDGTNQARLSADNWEPGWPTWGPEP